MHFSEFISSGILFESKDQLDISILNIKKYLTSDKKKEWFLESPCQIFAKTDGVKLTIIKIANTGDYTKDYIFSYKGNILYTEEFDYMSTVKASKESVGAAQFKLVFNHFKKLGTNNIPIGTELFVEYLMKKSTLSSNYERPHGMVLIAYSKSTYKVNHGKLKTNPSGFNTSKRVEYAKELKLNSPLYIFDGILGSESQFKKGIRSKELQNIFNTQKNSIDWSNNDNVITNISEMLLQIPSAFGGVEEGVVLEFKDKKLKIQQVYQTDQAERAKIKTKYREDNPEDETKYWNNVKLAAQELKGGIPIKSRKLPELLKELSFNLKRYKPNFSHSKKTLNQIKDDIQLTTKQILIKGLKGNNNALILGRFQPFTKGHQKAVKDAFRLYDGVVICIMDNKVDEKNPFPLKLRKEMVEKVFPDAEIISNRNGFIPSILNKAPINVNVVLTGSDRVKTYREQLKDNDVYVREVPRTEEDVSATKVRDSLRNDDFNTFKKLMPKELLGYFDKLKSLVK